MRFTSGFGTYDLDGSNIGHAVRLLGNRVARAEDAVELLHTLRPADHLAITDYLTRADRTLMGLAEANNDIAGWLDGMVLERYLEGFNSAVQRTTASRSEEDNA